MSNAQEEQNVGRNDGVRCQRDIEGLEAGTTTEPGTVLRDL